MAINQRTAQFFISYAREDKAFAVKLRRSLAARGRLAWLDLKNIKALALWRKEIAAAIDAADVFVFILSPDAVASAACRKELRLAVEAKKRLAPLVWREPDAKSVPPALRAPNWLFIRHRESTDRLVERLIEAADRDPDWIREHTRLLTRAREWQQHRRDTSRLLNGQGLQDALRWLAESGGRGDRPVNRLQAKFIEASREADSAAAARQRELYLKALARQLAAQSELTRGSSEHAVETPALLAIESLLRWPTVEGDRAMRRSLELVPRPPLVRYSHGRDAAVAMSADGTVFVRAVRTVLELVNVSSGATMWRVRLGVRAEHIEFGALEATIIVHSRENVVQVHDRADGARLGRIRPDSHIEAVTVHPNGSAIAVADLQAQQRRVRVWLFGSDAEPFTVELEHEPAAIALIDNFLVAVDGAPSSMGPTRVVVWEIGAKDSRRVLWELYGRPLKAVIADDGAWVALTVIAFGAGPPADVSVGALALRLTNPEAAPEMAQLNHDEPVEDIQPDGFGRLLSFTHKGSAVHVWEPDIRKLVGHYRVRDHAYRAALADGAGWLAVAHDDAKKLQSASDVSLVTDDGATVFSAWIGDHVDGLACDASGHITVSTGHEMTVWDTDTGSALRQLRAAQFTSLVFSADSNYLLVKAPKDGTLVVPLERSKPIIHLKQTGSIWMFAFAGTGAAQVVTVGNPSFGTNPTGDPHVRVWDVARAEPIALRHRTLLTPIAFTSDGRLMAMTAPDGTVRVRPIATAGRGRRFSPAAEVAELLFNEEGTHLAAITKNSVQIWRVADGALTATLAIREQSLRAFDPAKGLALLHYNGGYDPIGSIVRLTSGHSIVDHIVRPDVDFQRGRFAAVVGEGKIEVRELDKGRRLMKAFHEYVNGVELAPDGTHLVSTGADNSARVWQLAEGAEVARLEHPDRVLDAQFSPDSRFIATVCSDAVVRLWTWRAEDLVAEGRRRIPRALTAAELDSFLPDPETRR
jgi:WD40 repeat protein